MHRTVARTYVRVCDFCANFVTFERRRTGYPLYATNDLANLRQSR
jgi:hypothetical protein